MTSEPISTTHLLDRLKWRYSCRKYDTTRTIPEPVWSALEEALVLTPSSYGIQPWKFLVVTDRELRKKLYPFSHNQQPVLDASHLVIFTARESILPEDIEAWCRRVRELHHSSPEDFAGMRQALIDEIIHGPNRHRLFEWASEQAHIALGNFLTSCALLGIDASPMGGIKPHEFDEFFGFRAQRLRTVVLCAAGYRHPDQKGTGGRKTRFEKSTVIEYRP
ncbi:MAG: NAD(P)H-dependent oxidoreductase [Methylacidiphilales bacterium]|nr:NAD(P)H-dependent oxidoreductase [Candidatus Methylacidiphilales bacterium]